MNERVKELRKTLGLSGAKFGEPLGVQRMAISQIEAGKNNLTESMLRLICSTYNVNEDWLRTGEGNMFIESNQVDLNDLTKDADQLEIDILKAYFSLPKELRQKAIKHFKTHLQE